MSLLLFKKSLLKWRPKFTVCGNLLVNIFQLKGNSCFYLSTTWPAFQLAFLWQEVNKFRTLMLSYCKVDPQLSKTHGLPVQGLLPPGEMSVVHVHVCTARLCSPNALSGWYYELQTALKACQGHMMLSSSQLGHKNYIFRVSYHKLTFCWKKKKKSSCSFSAYKRKVQHGRLFLRN